MATRAAEMMLPCVFDGSLSLWDMGIKRRPYHRNCTCELHKSKDAYTFACLQHGNISFLKKRSWIGSSSSIAASNHSSQSSFPVDPSFATEEGTTSLHQVDGIELLSQWGKLRYRKQGLFFP